jgi:hypothetical protein
MSKNTNSSPDYEAIGSAIGALLTEKQACYGNAFEKAGEVLKILYPNGMQPYQYSELLALIRVLDKIFRISNLPEDKKDLMGEEPWKDIAGYAILSLSEN